MRDYSYTLLVDDLKESEKFYEEKLGWNIILKNEHYAFVETGSPLNFGLVEKEFIVNYLKISEIPRGSFVTWLYKSIEELESDKTIVIKNGLKELEVEGYFFADSENNIWELRLEGESI